MVVGVDTVVDGSSDTVMSRDTLESACIECSAGPDVLTGEPCNPFVDD